MAGLGRTMPWTMGAFVAGGLSLIGVPTTVGFVSKWYLILGAVENGWWAAAALVLITSLLSVIYIWRVVESAYFGTTPDGGPEASEVSAGLLVPTWVLVMANFYFGIDTSLTVGTAQQAALVLFGAGHMSGGTLIGVALAVPLLAAFLIAANDARPNVREGIALVAGLVLLATVVALVPQVLGGERPSLTLFEMFPGLSIRFQVEPLGILFAAVASLLWPLSTVYSVGYMRGNGERHQTRFYLLFAIAIASAVAIAFSANLLTLFICYEILTISTYPLVTHKGNEDARRGGRTYLGLLLSTSIGLLLPAILWTYWIAGTLEFTPGGVIPRDLDPVWLVLLLALYMFGIGKAALMPFHRWLPAAMVAPTPVSALLHAVAVVKAGVFSVMKILVYTFGIELLDVSGASDWLTWAAAFTLLVASLVAMTKDNLKARLAYSTVSQLSYVILGGALATSMGVIGGSMHIAMHAMGKITLFFCAGAIYTATQRTEISQLDGLGRLMPFTFGAYLVGALSIVGLPPLGGSWSKWLLMVGAADAQQVVMLLVLLTSSLLNVAYLVPVFARGFFVPSPDADEGGGSPGLREAPVFCVVPLCITASGCLLLFFFAEALYRVAGAHYRGRTVSLRHG